MSSNGSGPDHGPPGRAKVVVVFPYRDEYGTLRTLRFVLKALELAGYDVVCVLPEGAGALPHLTELGVEVRPIAWLGTFPRTFNPVRLASFLRQHLAATRAVATVARAEQAVLVYTLSEAVLCGSLAARRVRVPSIVHVIGLSIGSPAWVGKSYIRTLRRLTTRFVGLLVGRRGNARAQRRPHGADLPRAERRRDLRDRRDDRGPPSPIGHRGPKLGMVAAYDPRKGHELFVEAAARLTRVHPDARFYIVGGVIDGQAESVEFEGKIRELIADRGLADAVIRVGRVGSDEVYAWIRALDVFVLPSRTEAFGYVQYEAMACARPIVATRAGGNLDAFVDGESGLYVDQDADELAEAASRLLADPELASRLGRAARRRVVGLFAEEKLIPMLARVIDGTAGTTTRA